ncbi:MAG TPA: hypothetical protein VFV87_14190 [Pirellulaceae bacterium]|nr:hypothetical protein [Pirellulaceae bacterium]
MDPLHVCIALGPVAVYLLVLGTINLSPRPFLTSGGRDAAALGIAIAGFAVAGPMELFLPVEAAAYWGPWVWPMMLGAYVLGLLLVILMLRPRLVVYNATAEQLLPILDAVAKRLDPAATWAGESLTLPSLAVELHVESWPVLKNVQLVSAGPLQNFAGWRQLELELAQALRSVHSTRNPAGFSLLTVGLAIALAITYWLSRDPTGVQQALNQMLRH